MRKTISILLAFLFILCFSGCSNMIYPDLPADSTAYEMGSFVDKNHDDAMYSTIEYNGRIYMPYGTLGSAIHSKDIEKCIGYIMQDNSDDNEIRLFTLTDDPENNYLMDCYVGTNFMNQPTFMRAIDTKGKDIATPKFIESLEYSLWE